MKRVLLILVALMVIGAGAAQWVLAAWTAPGPAPAERVVLIAPGTSLRDIAGQLTAAGTLNFPTAFEAEMRLRGLSARVKAGEYAIPAHASMADIAAVLVAGKSIQHKLTIAEGLTSDMVWKLVKADPALLGDAGPAPEEGTLLPETYLFTRGMTRARLLAQMAAAQTKFLDQHWAGRDPGLPYTTRREAVILASIVEKEVALPEERRHVAQVFVNRLKKGMPLQSDPTIIYGLTRGYPLGHGIRQGELEGNTPYNTYVIPALPPGPIANPGKDALLAVLNPLPGEDLYFVSDAAGHSVFAATIAEHARNVIAFRAAQRAQTPPQVSTEDIGKAIPSLPPRKRRGP
jgi:UPF0755 protein